jgi:hypothetical protein
MSSNHKSLRCANSLRNVSWRTFIIAFESKSRWLAQQRCALVNRMALAADPDGTNVKLSVTTLARQMGCSRQTVYDLLDDLKLLGFVEEGGLVTTYKGKKVRQRTLKVAVILEAAGLNPAFVMEATRVQETMQGNKEFLRVQNSDPAHVSRIETVVSRIGEAPCVQNSYVTQPEGLPETKPTPTKPPKQGWEESFKTKAATLDAFLTPRDMDVVRTLAATEEYGIHFVMGAISSFKDRDMTGMRKPARAVFMEELETRFLKAKHDCLSSGEWKDVHVPGHKERQEEFTRRQIIAGMVHKISRDSRFAAECSAEEQELLARMDAANFDFFLKCPMEEAERMLALAQRALQWTPPPEDFWDGSDLFK